MSRPIRQRAAFFKHLQEGLQGYFDNHDRKFDGVLYFAVGVKKGRVLGIIRRDNPMPYAPKEYVGNGLYVEKRNV